MPRQTIRTQITNILTTHNLDIAIPDVKLGRAALMTVNRHIEDLTAHIGYTHRLNAGRTLGDYEIIRYERLPDMVREDIAKYEKMRERNRREGDAELAAFYIALCEAVLAVMDA